MPKAKRKIYEGFEIEKVNPGGRPSVYDPEFHPKNIIELSLQGLTKAEICSKWEIDGDTLQAWSKDPKKKEFSAAYKKALKNAENWYINFGKNIAAGRVKGANVTAYIWLTKNCLDWREKTEHSVKSPVEDFEFDYGKKRKV